MKKSLIICGILLFLAVPLIALGEEEREISAVDYPDVPRISALEAYTKYKAGKAIIIQAGGEAYEKRHIVGAYNVPEGRVSHGDVQLPNFPDSGVEIFVYCF